MRANRPESFRLINIVGIDGAGKTTLAKRLGEHLSQEGFPVKYAYGQYFAKLLYPAKFFAKRSVMRHTDEFRDYGNYNETKQSFSKRFPFLARTYGLLWLVDYYAQMLFRVMLPMVLGRRLVMDRYIIDIAVNVSLTLGKDVAMAETIIRRFCRFAPYPDLVVFIDLPEDIAFQRKQDIQSIAYLTERRERYLLLAKTFGFTALDGTLSQKELFNRVLGLVLPGHSVVNQESALSEVNHEAL